MAQLRLVSENFGTCQCRLLNNIGVSIEQKRNRLAHPELQTLGPRDVKINGVCPGYIDRVAYHSGRILHEIGNQSSRTFIIVCVNPHYLYRPCATRSNVGQIARLELVEKVIRRLR